MSRSMKIRNYIAALLAVVALVGCEDVFAPQTGSPIRFSVSSGGIDVSTRGEIDQEIVNNHTVPVRVTATKGGATIYNNAQLFRDAQTSEWLPTNTQEWETGVRYNFSANAYSPQTATSNGSLVINSPTSIEITQPQSYDPANKEAMVDYLLSQSFVYTVPAGSRPPIVKLDMEHAVSLVEINIAKHISFETVGVYLSELRLTGFFREANMTCPSPAQYGSGTTNAEVWQYTVAGSTDAEYSLVGNDPNVADLADCEPLALRDNAGGVRMRFLAIPQQLESSCELYVSYWVNEKYDAASPDNYVFHENTFKLFNYATDGGRAIWLPGHHITYTLEVDTGINLIGTIKPWIDVDYIEGTVLPDITAK